MEITLIKKQTNYNRPQDMELPRATVLSRSKLLMRYRRGAQTGVLVPLGVYLPLWRGTFKVSNGKEKYININFISK